MIVYSDYLDLVFTKIRNLKEHHKQYSLDADAVPVSVDDLRWLVGDMYGFHVSKPIKVSASLQVLRGMLLRFSGSQDNPHKILVRSDQGPYWYRFVVVKELSHLIIDEPEDWCPNASVIIDELFELFHIELGGNGHINPQRRIVSEHIAEMAAIELLYPYEMRAHDRSELQGRRTSYAKLEIKYEIPAPIISRALTPWYDGICSAQWQKLI